MIRRVAGSDALLGQADPDEYEHAHRHNALASIGAGPAGLIAVLTAARSATGTIITPIGVIIRRLPAEGDPAYALETARSRAQDFTHDAALAIRAVGTSER